MRYVPFAGCRYTSPSIVVVSVPIAWNTGSPRSTSRWKPPGSLESVVPVWQPVSVRSDDTRYCVRWADEIEGRVSGLEGLLEFVRTKGVAIA